MQTSPAELVGTATSRYGPRACVAGEGTFSLSRRIVGYYLRLTVIKLSTAQDSSSTLAAATPQR